MMLLVALALVAADPAPPFDVHGDYGAMIRQRCSAQYPDDFALQDGCRMNAYDGMKQFSAIATEIGAPIYKALERCVSNYTDDGLPDFAMIGACAMNQAEGYRRMHPEQ